MDAVLRRNEFHRNPEELVSKNYGYCCKDVTNLTSRIRFYAPSVYNGRISSVVPSGRNIHRPKNVSFSGAIDSEPIYGLVILPCTRTPCRRNS